MRRPICWIIAPHSLGWNRQASRLLASATLQVALATAGTVTVALDTSSTIDVAAEIARAVKDLAVAEKEVADCSAKLGNAAFVGKAPEKVVQKIRDRSAKADADVARLTERLRQLRGETS